MVEIDGHCDAQFAAVGDAFEQNFLRHNDLGASFTLYHQGTCVIDLVGGETTTGAPYSRDLLQLVFSSTKGAAALCIHMLEQAGQIDLNEPVATYWPEFAQNGKEDIPVEWLLTHKSGLADVNRTLTFEEALNWDTVITAIEESAPLWEPGTQHGYHAVTFGYLVGELVKRVTTMSLGTYFAKNVAEPLGLDFFIGLPPERLDHVTPIGLMKPPPGLGGDGDAPQGMFDMLSMLAGADSLLARALAAPGGAHKDESVWNDPKIYAVELASANGITNAHSLARMYAAISGTVDGIRLLHEEQVARAVEVQTHGPDSVLIFEIPFGRGFMVHGGVINLGGGRALGHFGAGGSLGFADPDHDIGFGYVMNQMQLGVAGDPRTESLIAATYASIQ